MKPGGRIIAALLCVAAGANSALAALPALPLRFRAHYASRSMGGSERHKLKLTLTRWSRPEDLRFLADVAHSSDPRRLWNETRKLELGSLQLDDGMARAVMIATLEETKFGTTVVVVGESPNPSPGEKYQYFALELRVNEAGTAGSGQFLRTARLEFDNDGTFVPEGALDAFGPAPVDVETIESVGKR